MLMSIPEWPKDSTLTHEATTWVLSRDIEGNNVEETVVEDTVNLNAWNVDKVIPTQEVWYVKALRHLKDENGNYINNTKWIGPKPIINDNSNVKDYLAPDFYVETPYIKTLSYVPSTGLTFELVPFESNVGYKNTAITITDYETGKVIYTDILILPYDNIININNVNFSLYNKINLNIVHNGLHSTVSSVYTETINLKEVYYRILGNLLNLDPYTPNTIVIDSQTVVPVTVTSARLLTLDNEFIDNCIINGENVTLPLSMNFNNSYIVELNLSYVDLDNNTLTITEYVTVTTRNNDEKIIIDNNFKYDYNIIKLNNYENDSSIDVIKTDKQFNTEEIFTNVIFAKGYNDIINGIHFDKELNIFGINNDNIYSLDDHMGIRLVTKENGFIQTRTSDNTLYLRFFRYNSYTETMTIFREYEITTLICTKADLIKITTIGEDVYLVAVNKDNNKLIQVYKVDITTGNLTFVMEYDTGNEMTDLTVAPYSDSGIIITPIGSNSNRLYVFSSNTNSITESLAIPSNFINKYQYSQQLRNGNIFNIRINEASGVLDFFIVDIYNDEIITKSIPYNEGGYITNMINLKNGSILFILNDNNGKSLYELI